MTITKYRGDTAPDKYIVTDTQAKTAVNIVGCILKLTVDTRCNPTDTSTQLFSVTGVITNPTAGEVEFSLNSTQANHVGYFYYDISLQDSNGFKRTLDKGNFEMIQDIDKS